MDWLIKDYFPLKRADHYLSWALGLCALLLYLLLPMRAIGYDSLAYAVETTSDIAQRHFHPHHLLFSRTQLLFLYFIQIFNSGISPLLTMAWFNSLAGALSLVFFYRLGFTISGRRILAALITVVLATSWTYHFFAASGDTVILPNLLLLIALYMALGKDAHAIGRLTMLALLTGLALLYHQMSIFYLPVVAIIALRACPRSRLIPRTLLFIGFSLGLAVAVYLIVMVFYYGFLDLNSWWAFLTADTRQSDVWGSYSPWAYLRGLGYLLNSGNYSFSIINPQGEELGWMIISQSLSLALLVVVIAIIIIRAVKGEWFGVVAGGSVFATMTFINWWEAPTTDYWVLPWMLVLLLLAWAGRDRLNTVLVIWLLFYIPAQLTINWHNRLAILTDPQSDLKGRIMDDLAGKVESGKVVLVTDDANLALRSNMAGMQSVLLSQKTSANKDAIGVLTVLFINPKKADLHFVVSDLLYREYKSRIMPLVPARFTQVMNTAFATATPLVEVSNRWGLKLVMWQLGRYNP